MRRALIPAAAALSLLTACQPQPISQADEQAIRDRDAAYVTAMNSGNVDAVVAMYTADAALMPPGMAMSTGTAAIKQVLTGMMGPMKFTLRLTPSKVTGQGDLAYVIGAYHFSGVPKDSAQATPAVEDGKYVEVFQRQADKSWRILTDIWNPNAAAPAPAAPARPARRH